MQKGAVADAEAVFNNNKEEDVDAVVCPCFVVGVLANVREDTEPQRRI